MNICRSLPLIASLLLVIPCFASPASAVTFQVLGPEGTPLLSEQKAADLFKSVGDFTAQELEAAQQAKKLTFEGDSSGISSINGMGITTQSVSETETRIYGWCFSVNGVVPETLANDTRFSSQADALVLFYGYARSVNGNWVAMCVPAWQSWQ